MNSFDFNFDNLIVNLLKIKDPEIYFSALAKGVKPSKAARKAGATCSVDVLEIFGSARLAKTKEEINQAYKTEVKSCMQNKPVGDYFSSYNIGVIWTGNFRILVCLETGKLPSKAYGFHGKKVEGILAEAGLEVMQYTEASTRWPLRGPSLEFSPFLDWHYSYYNSSPYPSNGGDNLEPDFEYEYEEDVNDSPDVVVGELDFVGQTYANYQTNVITAGRGTYNGRPEFEAHLLLRLDHDFSFLERQGFPIEDAHEALRARVLSHQAEVSQTLADSCEEWEDMPF